MNYLIGYKDAERNLGHEDPMLTEYTYGESGFNTKKLQKAQKRWDNRAKLRMGIYD
ncbi:hypothetical protein [Bacillus cereus]|uniref:hypothetical protein n=1 Tax=Bacillus cereus TaxID=1396 RepID=UPI001F5BAD7F